MERVRRDRKPMVTGRRRGAIVLESARLVLQPVGEGDRQALHDLEQDPEVMRYLNGGASTPLEPLASAPFLMPRGGEPGVWAVTPKGGDDFVGWVSLIPHHRSACLGFRFRRAFWGRGYAAEAATRLIDHGFDVMGLRLIAAQTMAVNVRSRNVLERLGLRLRRTYWPAYPDPLEGSSRGEMIYATSPGAWERQAGRDRSRASLLSDSG